MVQIIQITHDEKPKKEESGLSKQEQTAVDRIIKRRRPLLEAIGKL